VNLNLTFYKNKKICVALSGGGDSVSLLHYFYTHGAEYGITLSAVHCEHGIRKGSSLADCNFVKELCSDWGIPLFVYSADCPALAREKKVSLETAARDFRYESFQDVLKQGKADRIATAHHADDNAETVLFRLCRGTSLAGAGGIRPRAGFVRPLLGVTRAEIEAYLRDNALPYCHDETNDDDAITRNALRLRVLPELERIVPGATAGINRFATLAAADDEYLYRQAKGLLYTENGVHAVRSSDEFPLFTRACLCVLKEMGVEKDYTSAHLEALYALCGGQNGRQISLPQGIIAVKEYDRVAFYPCEAEKDDTEIPFGLGAFTLGGVRFFVERVKERKLGHGYFDLRKIPKTAVFRHRREGDVFTKFGGGEKKLKDYLIDRKIPRKAREGMVFLADGKEILAIVGGEIAERVKVEEGADICRIEIEK
jgi:tRNA(Ile)-lysidine synthase